MKKGQLIICSIVISLICILISISCEKNKEEQTNDIILESTEEGFDIIIRPKIHELPYDNTTFDEITYNTLLYKYDGYWSIKFSEYYKLNDRNEDASPNNNKGDDIRL